MNIYLDIDGVLLTRDKTPALHVTEFLKLATKKHACYWATTHCNGDANTATRYLADILSSEALSYCQKIKATEWSHKKVEIMDLSSDFLWFEDAPFEFEKEVLSQHGKLDSLVLVDLINNPNHLSELIKLL